MTQHARYDVTMDDLSDGQVIQLLQAHLAEMHKYSPPESIHALDVAALKNPALQFWSARQEHQVIGCGALKTLNPHDLEIKSMKVADAARGLGVGQAILKVLIEHALNRDATTVYLETGTHDAFLPARRLYEKFGFTPCAAFGDYKPDPYSVFYRKELV